MLYNNEHLSFSNGIANTFANHFKSVYVNDNDTNPSTDSNGAKIQNFRNYLILNAVTELQIMSASKKL